MVGGFNTNIRYSGRIFHVQTEDSGASIPRIVTLLYEGGSILLSKKTEYDPEIEDRESHVKQLMETQHREMVKVLKSGELDVKIGLAKADEKSEPEPATTASLDFGAGVISTRPLDEVILSHLAGE